MRTPIRIASVGLGWVATHRHLPAIRKTGDLLLRGVIDCQPGLAEKIAKKYRVKWHAHSSQLEKVDWLDEIDAISIATDPSSHFELISQALQRGKHVLTEKPFTCSLPEAERLITLAKENKKILAVVHNFQFSHSAQQVLGDIHSGRGGKLRSIHGQQLGNPQRRLPTWYDSLPLGLFYDESPHFFYLFRLFAGENLKLRSREIYPNSKQEQTPKLILGNYEGVNSHGEQIPVTFQASFASPVSEWHVLFSFEKYLGVLDLFRDSYLRIPNDGSHTILNVLKTSSATTYQHWTQLVGRGGSYFMGRNLWGHDKVFQKFATGILQNCEPPGISANDGLAVLALQHELIRG